MSLIHEALEKLEQEKKSGWHRPLPSTVPQAQAPVSSPAASKNYSGVIYALAGVLIFCFLAGLVYFFTRTESVESTSQAAAPQVLRKTVLKRPAFPALSLGGQFKLTGITQVGTEWNAIINNQLVRRGEEVNGALIESIEHNRVMLKSNDQILELKLYQDSAVR